jgi:hypothetical protein
VLSNASPTSCGSEMDPFCIMHSAFLSPVFYTLCHVRLIACTTTMLGWRFRATSNLSHQDSSLLSRLSLQAITALSQFDSNTLRLWSATRHVSHFCARHLRNHGAQSLLNLLKPTAAKLTSYSPRKTWLPNCCTAEISDRRRTPPRTKASKCL